MKKLITSLAQTFCNVSQASLSMSFREKPQTQLNRLFSNAIRRYFQVEGLNSKHHLDNDANESALSRKTSSNVYCQTLLDVFQHPEIYYRGSEN